MRNRSSCNAINIGGKRFSFRDKLFLTPIRPGSPCFPGAFALFEERPEGGQVRDVLVKIGGLGRLEAAGRVGETGVVDDVAERLFAYQPVANVVVPVDPRIEIRLRVVQVKRQHLLQADHLPDLGDRGVPALGRADVVAGGEEVRGVQADTEPLRLLDAPEDIGEVADAVADEVTVGITDFAQNALTDVVWVDLAEVGAAVDVMEPCASVESVKSVSEIYAPVSGDIVDSNMELEDAPERINEDPYGDGWIFRMSIADRADLDVLLDAAAYAALIGE